MYLRHFALTRLPFETPAHTDELFDSGSRREAQARLQHLIELRGIGLLTSEVGSLCANIAETPAWSIISEQGGKEDKLCW